MTIYLLIVAYLALLGFVQGFLRDSAARKRVFLAMGFVPLFLVMGLRAPEVGIDTTPYEGYYTRIGKASDFMHIVNSAPVYSVYNKILYGINSDPQFLLMCSSLIICAGIAYFVYHLSENVVMSAFFYVAFYFFCNAMNGMRQAMALSLCLVALAIVLKRRKWVLPLILCFLAFGVHNTCIVFVPFIFAPFIRVDKARVERFSLTLLAAVVVFAVTFTTLVGIFAALFPGWYGQYVDVVFSSKYAATGRNLIRTLFYAALLLVYYVKCVAPDYENQKCWLYLITLCGLALSTVFFQNYLLGERIPMYYISPLIVIVPNLLQQLQGRLRILGFLVAVLVSAALLVVLLSGNYAGVVPYKAVI